MGKKCGSRGGLNFLFGNDVISSSVLTIMMEGGYNHLEQASKDYEKERRSHVNLLNSIFRQQGPHHSPY